jgi:UDP-N-acetylglucosamine 3-dehydrogenase
MAKLAESNGVHLGVGHVERYNPAILQLRDRLTRGEGGDVHLLAARRTGPFPARIQDVGVITDLATHDVDIMMMLTLSSVERVYAETAKRIHRTHEDLFCGTLRFEDGQIGLLDINWLTPFKTRELSVVCERGTFVANYLTQELNFYENAHTTGGWDSLSQLTGVAEGNMVRYHVNRVEPLRAEIQAFTNAIRGEGFRYVTAENGMATLDVTNALLRAAHTKQTIQLTPSGAQ